VRVFIAVPLSDALKAQLTALQQEFRSLPVEAVWVREAGFHITLKFLGEVNSRQIGPIFSSMTEVTRHYHSFSLTLCGMGVFPHEASPRVLWVGIRDETGLLGQLQQTLEGQLAQIGYTSEGRPFTPHLTLARLKHVFRRGEFLAGLKVHREAVLGQLNVDHIELVESQLHPAGARYSTVKTAHFPTAADTLKRDE
jgi:RNA 2',3'-cyclic 3'-phosphodiesterase